MSVESYLARQPIVDKHHHLFAYELLFRQSKASVSADIHNPLQAGVEVISNTLCIGPDWLLHGKLAFINAEEATLMSDFLALLPPRNVVFEILESVRISDVLVARVQELRQMGYRFALDDFVCLPEYQPLMPLVDYIKLDVLEQPPEKTRQIIRHTRGLFSGDLIAEKVESLEMFELCRLEGVDYFQGYYFAHPENLASKTIKPAQATVLALMNKVRTCEDLSEIEEPIRRDAALTFRLIRFANSAALGLQHQIHTVRQAVTVIGLQALYRWLSLMLVTASSEPTTSVLARTAVSRGRMCELLGAPRLGRSEQDDLFIVGLFSLLDALMEVPLSSILDRVPLPEAVTEALLRRGGAYAPYLDLVEACEGRDFALIDARSKALGIGPEELNKAQLQTLAWVEALDLD